MLNQAGSFSSFSVDDLQKAKAFYQGVLALDLDELDMGLLKLKLAGGHNVIVYPKHDHLPPTCTLLNFLVPDIEEVVDQLLARGVIFEQYAGPIQTDNKGISRSEYGPAIAWFKDPAGNILSVLEENS